MNKEFLTSRDINISKNKKARPAAISLNEQNITYTPFRTVNSIEENGIELTYTYGPDQSRYKGIWKNNGTQYRKRIYASGYEINEETVNGFTTTHNISYVSALVYFNPLFRKSMNSSILIV